ncbi:type I methionyl aminopeptidase [Streptomyces sp. SID3343]|uniref:type I methionyl aminopeptidase n=1 Tax=Streptomyces sp. SID3343 TaxID=2690260 RepID=UPI001370350F|nr:type I methionyl aminopeptidase [Streptomyces sp. SID3343]MYW03706.1 type I methionyl aminopeptidase [Streptomyces sp. SID3343]
MPVFKKRHMRLERKTPEQIEKMRRAGAVVANTLATLREAAVDGISTAELDAIAEREIRAAGAIPSFKGYHGFPGSICASVNDVIVHGIPDDTVLRDGDCISIDCGAILDGWHGDSAITVPIGTVRPEVLELSRVCEQSMWAGIEAAVAGGRLTDISNAIEKSIRSNPLPGGAKYGIVEDFGGHGIGTEMHQDPHLLNYGPAGRGPRLEVGVCLAIEPMVTLGKPDTYTLADEWTVKTTAGGHAAHWEHSIAITEDGPVVLTRP